jgi:hypothetical protein
MLQKNYEIKRMYVEDLPEEWPQGWDPVYGPQPPGWPRKVRISDVMLNVILPVSVNAGYRQLLVEVKDKWSEKSDILDGECLRVRCVDARGKMVRLRVDMGLPWSEELLLSVRDGEVKRNVLFNLDETAKGKVVVWCEAFGLLPLIVGTGRMALEK